MRLGARAEDMVNTCEPLINVVTSNKPKRLIGLNQKVKSPGIEARPFSIADVAAPAERWDLSLQVLVIMRNLVSPYISLKITLRKASSNVSPWVCGYEMLEEVNASL